MTTVAQSRRDVACPRWRAAGLIALLAALPACPATDDELVEAGPRAVGTLPRPRVVPSVPGANRLQPVGPGDATAWANMRAAPAVIWPTAATADIDLVGTFPGGVAPVTRAGSTPISVGSPEGDVARARVSLFDRQTARQAGVDGLLFRLTRLDGGAEPGRLMVRVDYSQFRDAYGGGWSSRLRLMTVPECALTTPDQPACRAEFFPSANDFAASNITGDVDVDSPLHGASAGVLVSLTSGPASDGGSYAATSLQPTSTWSAGDQSGDFTWSYPLRVPPGLNGPEPEITLSYSSQSLDGRTAATNSQPAWIGDGFDYSPGVIERSYKACVDDGHSNVGDLCWGTDNAILSLPGHSGELIQISTNPDVWRLKNDDGTKVERFTDTVNGDDNNEYWKVTTPDATQYFFGLNRLHGWAPDRLETNSVFTVPVFGNNTDEPCNRGSFASSWCMQAYRWHLDYVVDSHENTMSLWYTRETNNYARNLTSTAVSSYVRGGQLKTIRYGTRRNAGVDEVFTTSAPAQVVFTPADRCVTPGATCVPSTPSNWPDVPWDQQCNSATSCGSIYTPAFFSQKRLASITTQVWSGSAYRDVERWTFNHVFKDPGDGNPKLLWLSGIVNTGLAVAGQAINMPELTFGGVQLNNRVDRSPTKAPIIRFRVSSIENEAGGVLSVNYLPTECAIGGVMPASADNNNKRCFQVRWTPPGQTTPIFDWFHKYVVSSVSFADNAGGNPTEEHRYVYSSTGPMWHYDDSELVKPEHKTWGQWRGYSKVRAIVGANGSPQRQTDTLYHQGLHGDKTGSGTRNVQLAADPDFPGSGGVNDDDWLHGREREVITYNGVGDGAPVVSKELFDYWSHGPTATRTRNDVTTNAYVVNTRRTTKLEALDGGRGWRMTRSTNGFDAEEGLAALGRITRIDDENDTTVATDDTCTRYTFATDSAEKILTAVARIETVAVRCATTPNRPADIVSDTRTFYDDGAFGTVGKGNVTTIELIADWVSGAPVYRPSARSTYDAYGRVRDAFDALERKTTTSYLPPSGGPVVGTTSTNTLGWTSSTVIDPAYGEPTRSTDVNGRHTDVVHDSLGRTTEVWMPGRVKGAHTPNKKFTYVTRKTGGPTAVSTSTLNHTGDGYVTTWTLYDGQLRERQAQSPAANGGRIIADTLRDSRGLVVQTNAAYFNAGAPGDLLFVPTGAVPYRALTSYDNAGRVSEVLFQVNGADFAKTTTRHGGDRTDVLPPPGSAATSTWTDALGRKTKIQTYRSNTLTGTPDETRYTYTRGDQVETTTDAAGNVWRFEYDLRGRKKKDTDPDRGATTYTFDDLGQQLTSTDARGVTLTNVYDSLGRKTALYQGTVATGTKLAEWSFDTLLKGQPSSSTRYVGGNAYVTAITGYDAGYRATGSSVTVPSSEGLLAGTYTTSSTFHVNGLPNTLTLPAINGAGGLPAETVTYGYNALGMNTTVSGLNTYVTGTLYDSLIRMGQVTMSNGGAKTLTQVWNYEEGTGRLAEHGVLDEAAQVVFQDVFYEYDKVSNVVSIKDKTAQYGAGPDDNQCFRYDHAGRLVEAWTPASGDCNANPTVAGLAGPAPYWQSFAYDVTGNRRSRTDHTAAGDTIRTSSYPAAGSARPHGLTQVTATGPGAGTDSFAYDAAGNLRTRNRAGKPGQTLTWDAEGRLAAVADSAGTTSYIYGPDGTRLLAKEPGGTTLYIAGQEVRLASGALTATRFYGTNAVRTAAGGLVWTTNDHHGTGTLSFKAATLEKTQRRATPFGEVRGPDPAWPSRKGFVGGTSDPTGLVHLGAREYDPVNGRFISVDPLFDGDDPESWNNYAYAHNNPTTGSDPSGLSDFRAIHVGSRSWMTAGANYRRYYRQDFYIFCRSDGACLGGRNSDGSLWLLLRIDTTIITVWTARIFGPVALPTRRPTRPTASCPTPPKPQPRITARQCSFWEVSCLKSSPKQWWSDNSGKVMTGVAIAGAATCAITAGAGCALALGVGAGISVADRTFRFHDKGDYSAGAMASFGAGLLLDLGTRGAGRGGSYDFALGLSRHPNHSAGGLVGRFSQHVNAKTYWDLYETTTDLRVMGENLLTGMRNAKHIHFNLDGMIRPGTTLKDLSRWGSEGIGQGNVTNWELHQVLSNPGLKSKSTFYLGGKPADIGGL